MIDKTAKSIERLFWKIYDLCCGSVPEDHPNIVIEDIPPSEFDPNGSSMEGGVVVLGKYNLSDNNIRLWADDSVNIGHIIDVLCHEHMHYLLQKEVDAEASQCLDKIVKSGDERYMLHEVPESLPTIENKKT